MLRKLFFRSFHFTKYNLFFLKAFSTDPHEYNSSNFNTSYLAEAKQKYNIYSKLLSERKGDEYKIISNFFNEMQGLRLGMISTDHDYFIFLNVLISGIKKISNIDQLLDIIRKIIIFDLKSIHFWEEILNLLIEKKQIILKNPINSIGYYYIIWNCPLRDIYLTKNPSLFREIENFIKDLKSIFNKIEKTLGLESKLEMLNLFLDFQTDFQVLAINFKNILINDYENISKLYNPLFLSELLICLYRIEYENNPQNNDEESKTWKVMNQLLEIVIYKDLQLYDSSLQNYEFSDYKAEEIGFSDNLSWKTLNNLMIILMDSRFFNEDFVNRIEDAIFRKSETDLINIENGSSLIYILSHFKHIDDNVFNRLIEMILWQFKQEESEITIYMNRSNLINICDGLLNIINGKTINFDLLKSFVIILAEMIQNKKINLNIFRNNDLKILEKLFSYKEFNVNFTELLRLIRNQINN